MIITMSERIISEDGPQSSQKSPPDVDLLCRVVLCSVQYFPTGTTPSRCLGPMQLRMASVGGKSCLPHHRILDMSPFQYRAVSHRTASPTTSGTNTKMILDTALYCVCYCTVLYKALSSVFPGEKEDESNPEFIMR